MSISTANGPSPQDFYWAKASDIQPPQTLSLAGNTLALSGGGGAVAVNAATSVALSTQKLTAVTYDTGLLETNVAGVLNVGLGSAIGSTRVEGGKVVIQRDPGEPQIEFVKGLGVERIKYDGTKLLMGSVGISGEIYDNFGSPGAAGQQLQSSGPGLPFVWGAGSGVGLTAVVAGTNIGVDNTNPIAPVVSVAISSNLDMSGQNIVNGNDITLKGANPSVNFQNIAGTDRAFLDYADLSDKVTLSGLNVVAEAVGAGRGHRMILDAAGAALTSQDADVTLQRSQTGLGIRTIATLEDAGVIQVGAPGIGTDPSISFVPTTGSAASIANTGSAMSITSANKLDINAITELNAGGAECDVNIGDNAGAGGQAKINVINAGGSSIITLGIINGSTQVTLEDTNGGTIALVAPESFLELRKGGQGGLLQLGRDSLTSVPTVRLQSGIEPTEFLSMSYNSTTSKGTIETGTNGQLDIMCPLILTATAGSTIDLNAGASINLGAITQYNTPAGVQVNVQADVDNLDQVLTNNAYVPMTWYKRDIGFAIDPAQSLAFSTGGFVWRYSGLYTTTNGESRYCGALRFQIDVNISAEDMNDTIVWWVRLFNNSNSAEYYSTDFPDERFGFIADRVVNPSSGVRNQCVSFSSTFNLDPGFTGQPIPVDGETLEIQVYGWGTTSTSTSRAQVSATIRPLRNLV